MVRKMKNECGITLVETMIAVLILVVGLLSMAQVLAFSVIASKTHGRDSGKITAAARDKMEELMALQFTDTASDTTVYPNASAGGEGLKAGGVVYPGTPQDKYHDHLDDSGARTTDPNNVVYTRQWNISNNADSTLKKITVSVVKNRGLQMGTVPSTLLISYKASEAPTSGF